MGPEILNIPTKLQPLITDINNYKYFLVEGGRGGGKSQTIARLLSYCAEDKKLRIVCGRETQNSLEESVYTIFKDLIDKYDLNFDVKASKITHNDTGSEITFKGFREQGRVSIKGLEAVDILWIDEAQSITQPTLNTILPTIRKNKAKVFFAMNRHLINDPVYKEFIARDDCLHIKVNFYDNPYCSDSLLYEAKVCQEKSEDDYDHIWEGNPAEEADNFLFPEAKTDLCKSVDWVGCGHQDAVMGVDVARYGGDKCVATILQRRGPIKWEVKHMESWGKTDLMTTTGRIIDLKSRFKPIATSIDVDGLGGGVVDRLNELKIYVNAFSGGNVDEVKRKKSYANLKTECYYDLEDMVSRGIFGCKFKETLSSLNTVEYTYKSNGQRIIVSKENMKARGISSPDPADSLMMAVHAIRFMDKKIQDNEDYRSQLKRDSTRGQSIFQLSGVR